MSKEQSHFSMFKTAETETGYIQCVIKPIYKPEFEALGFVDHPDKLKAAEKPAKRVRRTAEQIEADRVKANASH